MENLQVNVRMYNVGELGDCFLLNFTEDGQQSHVLIDCGSFRNKAESINRLKTIATDIQGLLTTGDSKPLDLVVATHQHNDHLSGFFHAADVFEKIGINEVWLSWLDDPADEKANQIAGGQRKLSAKLQEISTQLAAIPKLASGQAAERINDILGFYALDQLRAIGVPVVPQASLNKLKETGKKVNYLKPGQILDLPGLAAGSVKVYVLGPPRDNNLLLDINPGKDESYDSKLSPIVYMADGFLSGLTNFTGTPVAGEPFFPFDQKFERPLKDDQFLKHSYEAADQEWRKIDDDWLQQAERMALYLDAYTNNSSLVLAFEMVQAKKVLLFVGDAQTGNWLSWKTIDFTNSGISLDYLLAQTVLYKVGHHCSHNATLPESLEKMTHPELVAMIPVDISDAHIAKPNGWKMPAKNLYQRIKQITRGRILRMDQQYEPDSGPAGINTGWGPLLQNVTQEKEVISYLIK